MRGGYTRRRLLAGLGLGVAGLAGCVGRNPSVRAAGLGESAVFRSLRVSEPVATNWVPVGVTLTPAATTELNVRGLTVVDSSGVEFVSAAVGSGQTSKKVSMPVGQPATLTATDNRGRTVESLSVRVRADGLL